MTSRRLLGRVVPLAVLSVVTASFSGSPAAADDPTGSISGVVTIDGEPGCAKIQTFWPAQSGDVFGPSVTSDEVTGAYQVDGVAARDDVKLSFSSCTFSDPNPIVEEYWQDEPNINDADPVVVQADQVTTGIDPVLARPAKVSGTVTFDGSGDPVEGICVDLYNEAGSFVESSRTDASGDYTASVDEPGDHRIKFQTCSNGASIVPEWFEDAPDEASGELVALTGGDTVSAIDASVAPGGSISGTVTVQETGGDGEPDGSLCAQAYDESGVNSFRLRDTVDGDGDYTITGLGSGTYQVRFFDCFGSAYIPEWYDDHRNPDLADDVTVTAPMDTPDIDAELADWASDTTPPDTQIIEGPANNSTVNSTTVTFRFAGVPTWDTTSYRCTFDGEMVACIAGNTRIFSDLSPGQHTFEVAAADGNDNVDPTPATRTFTVDPGAPDPDPGPDPQPDPDPDTTKQCNAAKAALAKAKKQAATANKQVAKAKKAKKKANKKFKKAKKAGQKSKVKKYKLAKKKQAAKQKKFTKKKKAAAKRSRAAKADIKKFC